MAEDRTAPAAETEENLSDILRIRREKLAELRANGKDPFVIRRFDKTHDFKTIRDAFDALEGSDVIVAGRILSRRDMGKANFIDLVDESGKMQVYVKSDDIGADAFAEYQQVGHRRHRRREGLCVPHPTGRNFRPHQGDYAAVEVASAPARKVARAEGSGSALPPALCRSDRQPRGASDSFVKRSQHHR